MKRSIIITLFSFFMISGMYNTVFAQSPQFSIFDSFNTSPKQGEGRVVIHQSEEIKQLVGTRIDSENIDVINGKTFLITMGYRIQVYSGNNQRTSKDEAHTLQTKIKEQYTDIPTYVIYNAPFWKLHVGDFRSFEEASLMLRELRNVYPQKKNEIYILEDNIRLPLDH
jgi:Sporulation related domain.